MKTWLLSLFLFAGAAAAHPGHGDEDLRRVATEAAVRARVESEVRDLASAKKIDASWSTISAKRLERVSRNGVSMWMAVIENEKMKHDRELYLFTNVYGDVLEGGFAMDEKAATARWKTEVERLVALKKLPDTWMAAPAPSWEQRPVGASWEWVGTSTNPAATENPKLWIFLKPYGDFVAANHTGK